MNSNQSLALTWVAHRLMCQDFMDNMNTFSRLRYLVSVFKHHNLTSTQWQLVVALACSLNEVYIRLVLNLQVLTQARYAIGKREAPLP